MFLLCIFGMITKLFMLDKSTGSNGDDFALILFIVMLPFAYNRDKSVFSPRNDSLARWVYICLALYWLELFITVLVGRESLFNSIKVIRPSFALFAFFILKTISTDVFTRFLKIALLITLAQGVLFLLQFVGIYWLAGGDIDDSFAFGAAYATAINTPTLLVFFIFFVLRADYLRKYRVFLFVFFMSLLFLTFVRGRVISIMLGLAYYALVSVDRKHRLAAILAFLIAIPVALRVFNSKTEVRGGSGMDEIAYVLSSYKDFTKIETGYGTFSFRIAMLTERMNWLLNNPKYLFTGVGTMHEDSPKTLSMFDFSIGTRNEGRAYGYTLIQSGDITWVPITIRFGLVGIAIHFMMFIMLFLSVRKRTDILVVLAAYVVSTLVGSFNGSFFEDPQRFFILILFYSIVSRAWYEDQPVLL